MLVVVAAAAGAWWVLGRGGSDGYAYPLDQPVTDEPDLAWSWEASDTVGSVATLGDDTFVTDGGDVVALDEDGEERWTTSVDDIGYVRADPEHDDFVLVIASEESAITAISVDDGDELWNVDGDLEVWADDFLLTSTDEELARVDPADGDEVWSVDIEGDAGASPDAAYVVKNGELRKLSVADGDEEWTVDVDVEDSDFGNIAVADGYVALSGETEVVAFDGESGDELWTEDAGPDGASIGLMSPTQVFVAPVGLRVRRRRHRRRLRRGRQGREHRFRVGVLLRGAGASRVVTTTPSTTATGSSTTRSSTRSGAKHQSPTALVDGGIYELEDGELSYFGFDEKKAVWTVSDDFAEEAYLGSGDGRIYVLDGDELLTYS